MQCGATTTPMLHKAACTDDVEALEEMFARGADIHATDESSNTPLHKATSTSFQPNAGSFCNGESPHDPWRYKISSLAESVPKELLPKLVQMANLEDEKEMFQGVLLIRKLLTVERQADAPVQAVIDSGVCPRLVHCMQHSNFELQFQASWALCNVVSGNAAQRRYIIGLNVVPLWVQHLSNPSIKCVEQAAWAIGNIAAEGAEYRDHALEMGAMAPLLSVVEQSCDSENISLLQNAVWALSNLCRFKPQPAIDYVAPAVPVLARMVKHPDAEVALDAVYALSYICDGPQNRVQLVIDSGVVPVIVDLLDNPRHHLPAIRIFGNICSGNDKQTQIAIDAGCLPRIAQVLDPAKPRDVRKEALWTLSNIAAGNSSQIQALIEVRSLFPLVVASVLVTEAEVQREAIWVCLNIASSGTSEQINSLVGCGVLEALCQVLTLSGRTDVRSLAKTLEVIGDVLGDGARLVKLGTNPSNIYADLIRGFQGDRIFANLSSHAHAEICALAQGIMSEHFQGDTKSSNGETLGFPFSAEDSDNNSNNTTTIDSGGGHTLRFGQLFR